MITKAEAKSINKRLKYLRQTTAVIKAWYEIAGEQDAIRKEMQQKLFELAVSFVPEDDTNALLEEMEIIGKEYKTKMDNLYD